jgi:hypothetical protein
MNADPRSCRHTLVRLTSLALTALMAIHVAAACTDTAVPDPVLLEIVEGDGQEARIASALPDPLAVRVLGLDGLPRGAVPVDWSVVQGGGSVEPESAVSDDQGRVEARWVLGAAPGDQSVAASAAGDVATFRALATPPPPADWGEVVELRPAAQVQGEALLASVWLLNRWPGTVRLTTPNSCLFDWGYPALHAANGDPVARSSFGCWTVPTTRKIAPGDSLYAQWELDIGAVEAGDYTLRFSFAVVEINGDPATLPDVETMVTLGG